MTINSDFNISNNKKKAPGIKISKVPLIYIPWLIALFVLATSTSAYTEVEGQWFTSYVKLTGGGLFLAGIIVGLSGIIGTIFYLIWGTYSDNLRMKNGRRVPIYTLGAVYTALFMLIFITTTNYIILLILAGILIAITSNMFHVTNRSLIADLVPQERRGRVNSILFVASVIGSIIIWVPSLILLPGGEQSYTIETHKIFIGGGAAIIILSGIILFFLVKEPEVTEPVRSWKHDLKNLFNREDLVKHKDFYKYFIAMIFLILNQYTFYPYLLVLLQDLPLDFDLFTILIIGPVIGGGIGLGIYLMGKYTDKVGRKKVTLLCLIISPIGGIIISLFGKSSIGLIIGFGIMMPFFLGSWIATDSWTQDLLPIESRGRFLGIINIGNAIGKAVGAILAGFLADTFGLLSIFFLSGLVLWASIPFFMRVPETLPSALTITP